MTDIHPVGYMWHASFRVGDRIARGCIELIGGDFLGPGEHSQYFCSLDGKPFGRNDTLLDLQIAALERYGIPIESWTRKTDPA